MKHIKLFTVLLAVTLGFCWISGNAQATKPMKIFLNNGAKIEGAILGSFDSTRLYFTLNGQDSIAMKYDYIRKIQFRGKGPVHNRFSEKMTANPALKVKTYYHEFRPGLMFGSDDVSYGLHVLNGYQFNQYLGTGLGVGLNRYGDYMSLPLYASVKGYLLNRKVSPLYFAEAGYGFAWNTNSNENYYEVSNVKGGYYWQAGIGYQVNFFNSAFVMSLGYSNQQSSAEYVYNPGYWYTDNEVSEKRIFRRVSLSVGFLF